MIANEKNHFTCLFTQYWNVGSEYLKGGGEKP